MVCLLNGLNLQDAYGLPNSMGQARTPHMEALGIIASIYNHLEYTLYMLILTYSQLENNVAKPLFERMSNSQRLEFLRDCNESRTKDNPMHGHVIHFIKCFGIVADNRNTLMHSVIRGTDDEDLLWFSKASRKKPIIDKHLFLDIKILRRTALDLEDVHVYGAHIMLYCNTEVTWSKNYQGQRKGLAPHPAALLLSKKPALPSKLLRFLFIHLQKQRSAHVYHLARDANRQ